MEYSSLLYMNSEYAISLVLLTLKLDVVLAESCGYLIIFHL